MLGCHRYSGFAASLLSSLQPNTFSAGTSNPQVIGFPEEPVLRDNTTTPWSATVAGSPVSVTSVGPVSATSLPVDLGTLPTSGQEVTITYAPPPYTLHSSVDGATVNGFTVTDTA